VETEHFGARLASLDHEVVFADLLVLVHPPVGSVATGAGSNPFGACRDGLNFWITLRGRGKLARF